MRLKAPLVGHIHRQCLVCGRSFRVYRYRLARRNNGKFCTNQCLFAAWHLFSVALEDGRLEWLLKEGLAELLKEDAAKSSQQQQSEASRAYASWQRG
jgi:hypothetical protein